MTTTLAPDLTISQRCARLVNSIMTKPKEITALRRALETSMARDASPVITQAVGGIAETDADGRIVNVNEEYASLFRTTPENLLGKHWEDLIVKADHEAAHRAYHTMMQDGVSQVDLRAVRADGTIFTEHATLVKVMDRAAIFTGHFRAIREIAPHVHDAFAAQEARAFKDAMLLAAHDPFVLIDDDHYIREWNHAAERVFEQPRHVALAQPLPSLLLAPGELTTFLDGVQDLQVGDKRRIPLICLGKGTKFLPCDTQWSRFETGTGPSLIGCLKPRP